MYISYSQSVLENRKIRKVRIIVDFVTEFISFLPLCYKARCVWYFKAYAGTCVTQGEGYISLCLDPGQGEGDDNSMPCDLSVDLVEESYRNLVK